MRWGGRMRNKRAEKLGAEREGPSTFNCKTNFRFKIQLVPFYVPQSRVIFVPLQKLDNNRSNWHIHRRLIAHKALKGVAPVVAAQLH